MTERTLILLKPDAVERKLAGNILSMIEQNGGTIVALEMRYPSRELVSTHYAKDDVWFEAVGHNTIRDLEAAGKSPKDEMGTAVPFEIGKVVWNRLVDFMTSGPLIALILERENAVADTRKLVGHTIPTKADPESIRGRYGEKALSARNLIHASGAVDEAEQEINLWFPNL